MAKTVAVIDGMRPSSLVGGVMRPIGGIPMLGHLFKRLQLMSQIDELVVMVPPGREHDVVDAYCQTRGVPCFRVAPDNASSLIEKTLADHGAEIAIRVYACSPLLDPEIVAEALGRYNEGAYDSITSSGYPSGMSVHVYGVGTPPGGHRRLSLEAPPSLRRSDLQFEVQSEETLQVVAGVLESFRASGRGYDFGLDEVVSLIDNGAV